ncbi:MAG TPA: YggS family pyridoxal phosphate-dependent enzyme, partial [Anaerolineales bacterium]|nr:YggS family pyridoxal phosphate-dependent enzyme [Anaerolineales bacterium]
LRVEGLMTMAPIVEDPEEVRPVFAGLRALRDALAEQFPQATWRELSMGMTDDFEVAVEEGATMVRIGRAIFGPRPT